MAYYPGDNQHYNHTTENRVGLALSIPLAWALRNTRLGQPGLMRNDVRTDDIVSPWLTVHPHFQTHYVLNPQSSINVVDAPNMAGG